MLMINLFFPVFMFVSGLIVFCQKRKHLLLMLLSLEFVVVSLYYFLMLFMSFHQYEYFLSMVFLTMMVCESVLGLSILVCVMRTHGNDYFQSFNVLW
uniref:NADH-ubiquinone oxidoreductase chain 4L n=1 Tax=Acmaeodera sp. NCS-2009 TaxID=590154 RepID=D1G5N1_9COLE|nr:NADH dehydrogenase subunit 4L [Acmaeodera sp. NCS-2009]ACM45046.1 NADH dehydrogenase subunit 4L [Acmaeodera sp. NCS-2009]